MTKPTIICVDDDISALEALKRQIKNIMQEKAAKYSIATAVSGEEALELIEDLIQEGADIPLIISDHIMPGMKGDEFLIKAAKMCPDTKLVLLTGLADAQAVGRAINNARLFRYIGKPWTEEALSSALFAATNAYELPAKRSNTLIEESNAIVDKMNKDLEAQISAFKKFVPDEFLKAIHADLSFKDIKLGLSVERYITIMFVGIEFSNENAVITSLKNHFQVINRHFTEIIPIIMENNGFIDKYFSNNVMALFLDTDDAVKAAIQLLEIHSSDVKLKIGINVGQVRLGTIGDKERFQTTVIGDVVNMASRVQNLTKQYKSQLLMTGDVVKVLKNSNKYEIQCVAKNAVIKGKATQTDLYKISQF